MRSAFIADYRNFNNDPANGRLWDLVSKYSLDGLMFDVRQVTKKDLDFVRSRPTPYDPNRRMRPQFMLAADWFDYPSGRVMAETANNYLGALGFTGANATAICDVMFDDERHDMSIIEEELRRFRALRYARQVYWTPEPNQGGLIRDRPSLRDFINADINCGVVPQAYFGSPVMAPVAHDAVKNNVTLDGGIDVPRVKVFYGSYYRDSNGQDVRLPIFDRWDGWLFDLDHA